MKRGLLKNNSEKIAALFAAVMIVSVLVGSFAAVFLDGEQNTDIYRYLTGFFSSYGNNIDKAAVCRRSVGMNMRIFIPVTISGFFIFGNLAAAACMAVKGFIWGFCGGLYVKYYGVKGILLSLASLPSCIIVVFSVMLFSVIASELRKERDRKNSFIRYMIISLMLLLTFSTAALVDAFVVCPALAAVIKLL
ncbi:MAG: stage II sporulation protein M [Oscillospiraceae bacterium]|nr:stage II sporulation protein M [Oscillospiraceae bacterium]